MGATAAIYPIDQSAIIEQTKQYIEKNGLTKQNLATDINVSRSLLSRVLSGKYESKNSDIYFILQQYLEAHDPQGKVLTPFHSILPNKPELLESRDAKSIVGLCNACQESAGLGMIVGNSGYGKTHTLKYYTSKVSKVKYIVCEEIMGIRDFIKSIERALGIPSTYKSSMDRVEAIKNFFNSNPGYLLIIDEADKLITRYAYRKMEIVRGIYDQSKVGIVLAGEPRLRSQLEFYLPRMENRLGFFEELAGLSPIEISHYLNGYQIAPEALEEMKRRGSQMKKSCFRLLDRTLENVIRILEKKGETLITLDIINEASNMMPL